MRKKQPVELGLHIDVWHADSVTERPDVEILRDKPIDADGHAIECVLEQAKGEALMQLVIKRGVSAVGAAEMLRKLANLLEEHGARILNWPRGMRGWVDGDNVEESGLFAIYEDDGNPSEGRPKLENDRTEFDECNEEDDEGTDEEEDAI